MKWLNMLLFPGLLEESKNEALTGSIMVILKSALLTLGLGPTILIVAVLVPAYEEFLFRGIFLDSAARYFPFWLVNGLQSFAFAAIHDEFRLFPSFFVMGITLGWLARKTGSLFLPILVHSANNFLAITTIWHLLRKSGQLY